MKLQESVWNHADSQESVITQLVSYISEQLAGGNSVLWLVSGGSNIQVAVEIQKRLQTMSPLDALAIGLVDERYGEYKHEDSNWQQLNMAGWDKAAGTTLEVVSDTPLSLSDTADQYEHVLRQEQEKADTVVALFGIGQDGHTAGVLPHAPIVDSAKIVDSFIGPDYKRISITPAFMPYIDLAIVAAFGEAKQRALENAFEEGSIADVPARMLAATKKLIVYTDNNRTH